MLGQRWVTPGLANDLVCVEAKVGNILVGEAGYKYIPISDIV